MILVAVGSNLPHPDFGPPFAVCQRAVERIGPAVQGRIVCQSGWYRTRPEPDRGQPWYVNGVVALETDCSPEDLLAALHRIEADFGRKRSVPAADRTLDLDLLDHNGHLSAEGAAPCLPHPRLHTRAFVLVPLLDCAPDWVHPRLGTTAAALLAGLADHDNVRPIA